MSTNFYLHRECPNACAHCSLESSTLHIGKRSGGWVFLMRAHGEPDISSVFDWQEQFLLPDSVIKDEYGTAYSVDDFWREVDLQRGGSEHTSGMGLSAFIDRASGLQFTYTEFS